MGTLQSVEHQGRLLRKHEEGVRGSGEGIKVAVQKCSRQRCPFLGKPWPLPSVPRAFTEGAELWRLHGEGLSVLKLLQLQMRGLGRAPGRICLADGWLVGMPPCPKAPGDPRFFLKFRLQLLC